MSEENPFNKGLSATDGVNAIHVPGTARWYWADAHDTMDHRRVVKVWRATGPSEDSVIWRSYGVDVTDLVGTAHYPHALDERLWKATPFYLIEFAQHIGVHYAQAVRLTTLKRLATLHGIVQAMDLTDVPILAATHPHWDVRHQALRRLAGKVNPSITFRDGEGPSGPVP